MLGIGESTGERMRTETSVFLFIGHIDRFVKH
jgi:hypothetical protein